LEETVHQYFLGKKTIESIARMKLPVDEETNSQGENQSNHSGDREHDRGNGVEDSVGGQGNGSAATTNGSSGSQEPDFSEYLWMEHEEEFDEQVLRELEDEEMINYYFELYEASIEEEEARKRSSTNVNNGHNIPPPVAERNAPASVPPGCSFNIPESTQSYIGGYNNSSYQNQDEIEEITRGFNRVSFASRLNPNAAEFIPRGQSSVSVNPSADNDSRPPPDSQPC
jgi:hypothetical protein